MTTYAEMRQESNSLLAMMFSGKFPLPIDAESKAVLISRNGDMFAYILSWLRDNVVPNELSSYDVVIINL